MPGLKSYIEKMRSEGKPLYFTNTAQNPESWPTGQGDVYSQPEETWNRETHAEINRPASGFDYSEEVGQRFPLANEDPKAPGGYGGEPQQQGQPGGAGGQKNKGYILNQALAELQTHIPGIVKHTLGGKSKPTNAQEKKAVQKNIQAYLKMTLTDMEKAKEEAAAKAKATAKSQEKSGPGVFEKKDYDATVKTIRWYRELLDGPEAEYLSDEQKKEYQQNINDGIKYLEYLKGMDSGGGMQIGGQGQPGVQGQPGQPGVPGAQQAQPGGQQIDRATMQNAVKAAVDSGYPEKEIIDWGRLHPHASLEEFNRAYPAKKTKASPETKRQETQAAPDVMNTPVVKAPAQSTAEASGGGMQRKNVPYHTSMTQPATEEQAAAAKQNLIDFGQKLGFKPDMLMELIESGQLGDVGAWAGNLEAVKDFFGKLIQHQRRARQQSVKRGQHTPEFNQGSW